MVNDAEILDPNKGKGSGTTRVRQHKYVDRHFGIRFSWYSSDFLTPAPLEAP